MRTTSNPNLILINWRYLIVSPKAKQGRARKITCNAQHKQRLSQVSAAAPESPDVACHILQRARRSVARRRRRSEDDLQDRNVDEHQRGHRRSAGNDGGHQLRLAVEALGPLHGAVLLERELEVHRHDQRDQREREDQLEPIAHDERAEEEHRRRAIEHDRNHQPLSV